MIKRSIIWFRLDLRLHDNEALIEGLKSSDEIIPVYVFDTRLFFNTTSFGFKKTGLNRAHFLIRSVQDLRRSLSRKGIDLIIRIGHPEKEIFNLASQFKTSWVFCNRERTRDEVEVQDRLEKSLWSIGQEMRYSRGKMLYYTQDLPFPVTHTPDTFSVFRKEVENYTKIRRPLLAPTEIPKLSLDFDVGEMPTLSRLGYQDYTSDPRSNLFFDGGETAGLQRLESFFWDLKAVEHYNQTKNDLVEIDDTSRFSPWISHGCVSPKMIYQQLEKLKSKGRSPEAIDHFSLQLIWRDYHRLIGKKYENKIFLKGGTKGVPRTDLHNNYEALQRWVSGKTDVPLVDACMHELASTGYLSRRGRELVSSYLINEMKVNWQMGAEYFESALVDYDPCSNYGNWNLAAGVGCDNRKDPSFNLAAQARRLDPQGAYIRKWARKYEENTIEELNVLHEQVG